MPNHDAFEATLEDALAGEESEFDDMSYTQKEPSLAEMLSELITGTQQALDEMIEMRDFALNNTIPRAMNYQLSNLYRDAFYNMKHTRAMQGRF